MNTQENFLQPAAPKPVLVLKLEAALHSISQAFVLGGRATFTVKSGKTGNHLTFKVKTLPDELQKPIEQRMYFASVMTGRDNETSYSYMGLLKPMSGDIVITKKSKFKRHEKQVAAFLWAIDHIWHNKPMPAGTEIMHAGKCGCCGRKLTTPESVTRGIGPECWKRFA